jgi:glutaredoxin-related protein
MYYIYIFIIIILLLLVVFSIILIILDEEFGLEINVEKTKYMLLSSEQNVDKNLDMKIANRSFENVSQFKYLGITVTNQNLIQEEIKRRLNSANAC